MFLGLLMAVARLLINRALMKTEYPRGFFVMHNAGYIPLPIFLILSRMVFS